MVAPNCAAPRFPHWGQQVKLGPSSWRKIATNFRVEMIYPRCSLVLGALFGFDPLI
jgi:hypothetical protein